MPLQWNIEKTEMGDIRTENPKCADNCTNNFINAVGLAVLNRKVGGYNYSLESFVLTKQLMIELKNEWISQTNNEEEKKEIMNWLPKLVGARFQRTP